MTKASCASKVNIKVFSTHSLTCSSRLTLTPLSHSLKPSSDLSSPATCLLGSKPATPRMAIQSSFTRRRLAQLPMNSSSLRARSSMRRSEASMFTWPPEPEGRNTNPRKCYLRPSSGRSIASTPLASKTCLLAVIIRTGRGLRNSSAVVFIPTDAQTLLPER